MSTPATLTITAISTHLGISRWTVSRLIEAGELPATQVGGRWPRVAISDYWAWLGNQVVSSEKEDNDMTALPDLISFETAAATFEMSVRTLTHEVKARNLAHLHRGKRRWFTPSQWEAYLDSLTVVSAKSDAKSAMAERRSRRQSRPRRPVA